MSEVAVVTGGTRGIGAAIAKKLLSESLVDRVLIISKSKPSEKDQDSRLAYFQADLSTELGIDSAISFVQKNSRSLNLLVNNAGAIFEKDAYAEVTHTTLVQSFNLHAVAHLRLSRELANLFVPGQNNLIVNIGSIYGSIPDPYAAAYVISKSTVPIVTQLLAGELAPQVRVNSIAPGHIATDMTAAAPADYIEDILSQTPAGRLGTPEEVAELVSFLWSAKATFITGAHFRLDGGFWKTVP